MGRLGHRLGDGGGGTIGGQIGRGLEKGMYKGLEGIKNIIEGLSTEAEDHHDLLKNLLYMHFFLKKST